MPVKTEAITCLSVRYPFAHWLLHPHPKLGFKTLENRTWTSRFRGTVFIHASRWSDAPRPDENGPPDATLASLWKIPARDLQPLGHVIGCVDLVHSANGHDIEEVYCVIHGTSVRRLTPKQEEIRRLFPPAHDPAWEWWNGSDGAFLLANPRELVEPIPTGGKLGLWRMTVASDRLQFQEVRHKKRRRLCGGRLDDPQEE